MAIDDGIIQRRFVRNRHSSKNKCYICGEARDIHLKESDNNQNNLKNIKEDEKEDNENNISSIQNSEITNNDNINNSINFSKAFYKGKAYMILIDIIIKKKNMRKILKKM